ncbi:Phage abortive infection protein [Vibrio crassostreae]|uniref:hypothetical protein n=1 Tax=Vibrio crassostreae TaxID=246167 RepID=UPI0010514E55|nr:hypothetical protein [Vibrio crassostreae]TCN87761.1 hypothetical protein EDB37_100831 [Vibrio crassostreae]CAK2419903.1 Phage abortive infection protein [Vibrio crassostreae]CAK2425264.1 Phage abortive infection protein [Vibrio crassostreae]CAK3645258.1 Phage abortive infection protein [Vibrio crassostreae]CAK3813153.1 Phage abortive infection protein [Vibrio crassostreae]
MSKRLILGALVYLAPNLYFSYLICSGSKTALWSNFSGLATVNVAFLTALIVIYGMRQLKATNEQLQESKKVNIRSLSHESYSKYLQLTLEYPNFSYPNPDIIRKNKDIFAQYRWFIANMLFYFEEVLVVNDKDKNWSDAISKQVRIHSWYLSEGSYKRQSWSKELVDIITKEVARSSFRKKRNTTEQSRKNAINVLYERYLELVSSEPQYYQVDVQLQIPDYDRAKHTLFLKRSFFLLGQIAELSVNDHDWLNLVKLETSILQSTYDESDRSRIAGTRLMTKHHQRLLQS